MSFLLDPFLAFMLGLIFSFITRAFKFKTNTTKVICGIAISLATSYSILLYLKVVATDFLVLDLFAKILPIEQQVGPRIMFHSNASEVVKESFPIPIVIIFYALYFLWFYLGFQTARNVIQPPEPTPSGNPQTSMYIRIGGALVFVSAGMMLFFFTMIPLDEVIIGEAFGTRSSLEDKEIQVRANMVSLGPANKLSYFSDELCNPDKLEVEKDTKEFVDKDSNIELLANQIQTVSVDEIKEMCQAREDVGQDLLFLFVNLSTWLFLVGIFMISRPLQSRNKYWDYGGTKE